MPLFAELLFSILECSSWTAKNESHQTTELHSSHRIAHFGETALIFVSIFILQSISFLVDSEDHVSTFIVRVVELSGFDSLLKELAWSFKAFPNRLFIWLGDIVLFIQNQLSFFIAQYITHLYSFHHLFEILLDLLMKLHLLYNFLIFPSFGDLQQVVASRP